MDKSTKNVKKAKRNNKGQFVKGAKGISPGRPRRQTETEYLDRLRENITLDKWDQMVNAMWEVAIGGDVQAFNAICKWVLPKDTPEAEIERIDEDPEGLA